MIIFVLFFVLGDDIIKVLKRAAVDPITYRQYILYLFTGKQQTQRGRIIKLPNKEGGGVVRPGLNIMFDPAPQAPTA